MNHGLKLTPKIIIEMAEDYKAGKTTPEISKKFNMSKATVCRGLRKMGIEPERHDNLFTDIVIPPEIVEAICKDYKSGLITLTDLVRRYKHTSTVIIKVLKANNLYTKKPTDRDYSVSETKVIKVGEKMTKRILSDREQRDLCEQYVDGPQTKPELAEEYQIHLDTVNAILRKHKVLLKKYVPEEIVDQMVIDFEAGTSLVSLIEIYNLNPEIVRYHLTKRGVFDKTNGVEAAPPSDIEVAEKIKHMSSAAFREMAKKPSPRMLQIIESIADDPTVNPRTRATCAQIVIEIAHGKPKETKEEEEEKQSTKDRILKLVSNNEKMFKKKA